jgi:hypothetical protein
MSSDERSYRDELEAWAAWGRRLDACSVEQLLAMHPQGPECAEVYGRLAQRAQHLDRGIEDLPLRARVDAYLDRAAAGPCCHFLMPSGTCSFCDGERAPVSMLISWTEHRHVATTH